MSAAQRENLDAILRQSVFPAGADVSGQRRLLRELTSTQPPPVDVTLTAATLSGVRTAEITIDGIKPGHTVLMTLTRAPRLQEPDLVFDYVVWQGVAPASQPEIGPPPGTELGRARREKISADVRQSPGGYRSFHSTSIWHSGFRGGK